ncbi:MAG: hypothetical protein H6742_02985 [Alphaproteobacteria bacterium]|nr:hypothetical protein [Alphaproteobacteria bacterium]
MLRSRPSSARFFVPALLLAACGDGLGPPDASWTVTMTSTADQVENCGDASFGDITETWTYDLYAEGSSIDIFIDGQSFASGVYEDGCNISYESPSWLDSYDDAEIQWGISGRATVDGPAGGCVDAEGVDWDGVEEVKVVRSGTESLPIGCTRTFDVTGALGG